MTSTADGFELSSGASVTAWVDGLILAGGDGLLGYRHPHFGRFPAVVTRQHGRGRITTVGTVPDPVLAADLVRWLVPEHPWGRLPESVGVHSATNASGDGIHVVHNWSWDRQRITCLSR